MRPIARRALSLAVIVVFAGGAAACIRQGMTDDSHGAKHLYVRGKTPHVSNRELARVARPYLEKPFFDIDTTALQQRLERIPWLYRVSVTRRWPDGVVVDLHERRPVARWNNHQLLAANGDLFRPDNRKHTEKLPRLAGHSNHAAEVYAMYRRLAPIASAHGRHLAGLSRNRRGNWNARLASGLQLRLGKNRVVSRMHRFADFADASKGVAQKIAHAAYVDLRYTDGFAVGGKRSSNAKKEHTG